MTKKTRTLGVDGLPVPPPTTKEVRFKAVCVACWGPSAKLTVTKADKYTVFCPDCRTRVFFGSPKGELLFRGFLQIMDDPAFAALLKKRVLKAAGEIHSAEFAADVRARRLAAKENGA